MKRGESEDRDYSALKLALASLTDILKQPMNEYVRDGVIQRFEYTFELSWKALARVLKDQGVDVGSPKQVFRAAFKAGLIDSVEDWFGFLKNRNLTTHIYNAETASEVYEASKRFPPFAEKVLRRIKAESGKG